MSIDFSIPFHESSKDLGGHGAVRIPKDYREWPADWKTTFYKDYGKMSVLELPAPDEHSSFFSLVQNRASERDFTDISVSPKELSSLLAYACGEMPSEPGHERHRRAHPSGGARYPIETYPLVFRPTPGLPAGVYHYNVRSHALDVLWEREFTSADISGLFAPDWVQNASAALILTGVFRRTKFKYGERGYRYILLEAGHIGQNVYLASASLGLKCCGLVGTRDTGLETLLDIDGVTESVVYALIIGK